MLKTSEGRERLTALRPSETVPRQSDISETTVSAPFLQASRLTRRFKMSPAVAAVMASLAYDTPENWRRA